MQYSNEEWYWLLPYLPETALSKIALVSAAAMMLLPFPDVFGYDFQRVRSTGERVPARQISDSGRQQNNPSNGPFIQPISYKCDGNPKTLDIKAGPNCAEGAQAQAVAFSTTVQSSEVGHRYSTKQVRLPMTMMSMPL